MTSNIGPKWLRGAVLPAIASLISAGGQAQTAPPQVIFNVQIVQADTAAGNAFASKRERQAVDFNRTDQMNIHVLRENTPLDTLVAAQTRANAAELVSLPKMTTTAGVEAHFLIGGRYPVPTIDDPAAPAGQPAPNAAASPKSEFGIRLTMRPIPLTNGLLRVRVKPRVQTVDFGNSTTRGGKFVPAIVTRQINRSIDLKPGQSFAITGLLNHQVIQLLPVPHSRQAWL